MLAEPMAWRSKSLRQGESDSIVRKRVEDGREFDLLELDHWAPTIYHGIIIESIAECRSLFFPPPQKVHGLARNVFFLSFSLSGGLTRINSSSSYLRILSDPYRRETDPFVVSIRSVRRNVRDSQTYRYSGCTCPMAYLSTFRRRNHVFDFRPVSIPISPSGFCNLPESKELVQDRSRIVGILQSDRADRVEADGISPCNELSRNGSSFYEFQKRIQRKICIIYS